MIPLFKSHYSAGKSILKIEDIFAFPEETIVMVEDCMAGFRRANLERKKAGKKLIFGLRLETKQDFDSSKVIYFAKNDEGISSLRKIYTKAKSCDDIYNLDLNDLNGVEVAIPFYDSYIFNSIFHFGAYSLDFGGKKLMFFEERNEHPFDFLVKRKLNELNIKTTMAKSIYYDKNEDFKAYQCYKAFCQRSKPPTFGDPNVKHLSSNQFSYESYKNAV